MTEKIDYFLLYNNVVYGEYHSIDKFETHIPLHATLNIDMHDMFNKIEEEKKLVNSLQQDFKKYTKNVLDANKLMLEKFVFIEGL